MAVRTSQLENPERDLALDNREGQAAEQLRALRQRIRAGLNQVGKDPRPKEGAVCQECFQRGWLAALKALEA